VNYPFNNWFITDHKFFLFFFSIPSLNLTILKFHTKSQNCKIKKLQLSFMMLYILDLVLTLKGN